MSDKHKSKGQSAGPVNQHKRMAEGEKITGMKHGGKVKHHKKGGAIHEDEHEDKKMLKKVIKPSALKIKLKHGGMSCMKKGGHTKKGK